MSLRLAPTHRGCNGNTRQAFAFRNGILFHWFFLSAPTHKDKAMARKYSKAASKKVEKVMHERKAGTLKSGSGRKVKSRKQAIAIGLSEARKEGKKVPKMAQKKS
jgi:hypothetical protein